MKKLLRVVAGLVVLVIVVLLVVVLRIDAIAKTGVEKGGTYALGVETSVDELSLSLLRGKLMMKGLKINNPPDFTSDHLMRSGRFDLELVPTSVLGETIELKKFELDGLDVNIEQKITGSNISTILENLKRFDTGEGEETEAKTGGKKIKVDRIVIRNVVVHFHLLPELSPTGPVTVEIPQIELTEVTSDNASGVVVGELVRKIIPAIIEAILKDSKGKVPTDFLSTLDKQVVDLGAVLEETDKTIKSVLKDVFGIDNKPKQ